MPHGIKKAIKAMIGLTTFGKGVKEHAENNTLYGFGKW